MRHYQKEVCISQCAVPNDSVLLLEQRCVAGLNSELTVHIHKMEIERMLEIVVEKALDVCRRPLGVPGTMSVCNK